MLSRLSTALATILISCTAALGDWEHSAGEHDPFKGGAEHIAVAAELPGVLAGFRCTSQEDLAIMFIPIEKGDTAAMAMLAGVKVRLLVIVDDQPRQSLPAALGITPDGERFRVEATGADVAKIVLDVAAAKKRLAMAGEINGKIAWSHPFGTAGSRRALQPLIDSCKLKPAS